MKTIFQENAIVSAVLNRRSHRKYSQQQLQKEHLDLLLRCAFNAPSARNYQPWFLSVVQSKKVLQSFKSCFMDVVRKNPDQFPALLNQPDYDLFYGAPTVIFVFGDSTRKWVPYDCSFLAQNVLLAAESLHIGSCIIGCVTAVFEDEAGKKLTAGLNAPDTFTPQFCIALGYTDGMPEAQPRSLDRYTLIG